MVTTINAAGSHFDRAPKHTNGGETLFFFIGKTPAKMSGAAGRNGAKVKIGKIAAIGPVLAPAEPQ
jgi:hypothetical protein